MGSIRKPNVQRLAARALSYPVGSKKRTLALLDLAQLALDLANSSYCQSGEDDLEEEFESASSELEGLWEMFSWRLRREARLENEEMV